MSHPVEPNSESTLDVFQALMDHIEIASDWDQNDRFEWQARWNKAAAVAQRRRDYDREWDESEMGIGYDQSGSPFVKRYGQ